MSIALAPLTVTAGTSYSYPVGARATVGAVVALNESPYGLNISTGASSQWIAAQTADLVPCDSMGFNGALTITTDSYLDNASSAPSFLVYFTAFAPGETIRGTYPSPLARLTNGGNVGIASQLVNDGNPSGTNIVEATPSGSGISDVTLTNGGVMSLAGTLTTKNSFVIHPSAFPQPFTTFNMPDNADAQIAMTGVAGPGNYNNIGFSVWENGAGLYLFSIGSQNQALAYIDGAGVLHATGPVTLATGHQETGYLALSVTASAAGQVFGLGVNFKTTMTNVPSSITLTNSFIQNAGSVTSGHITTQGFYLQFSSTVAGNSFWIGSYTTVGN